MDDIFVDNYKRNRALAVGGGLILATWGAWLWFSAPAGTPSPDFASAREVQVTWAKGFLLSGLLALVIGLTSFRVAQRPNLADRLAALGWTIAFISGAGATVLFLALEL